MQTTIKTFRFAKAANILAVVAFLFTSIASQAQTGVLSGTVMDAATSKPLPFASVYVNRTTLGAEADGEGKFTLSKLPAGNIEVVCSFVGYQSTKTELQFTEGQQKEITIKLVRLSNELEAVTVTGEKDNQWKKDYSQFKKAFLGKDEFADQCEVANAGVIEFTKTKTNGLTAVASQPLEVINPALGYRLFYELLKFNYSPKQYLIYGNIRFEVLETDDPKLLKRWKENRMKAYTQSLRYLFKTIFDNRIAENGFELYVDKAPGENLSRAGLFSYVRNIVTPFQPEHSLKRTPDARFFVFTSPTRMEIHDNKQKRASIYRDVLAAVSWLETKEPLIISRTGIVQNPAAVELIGAMSEARVAQLLPEDYSPDNIKIEETVSAPPKPVTPTEKIYVHTDKDYYYPGDIVWFKGYMTYGNQSGSDSLSRVGYVDLIDSTKRVIIRKVLPIEFGAFHGEIELPISLSHGNYVLRAYTEYMRNFGEETFFYKPVPILDAYQRVGTIATPKPPPQQLTITIEPSKSSYKKREEIQLVISIQDEDGAFIPADLSVSVVDAELFKPLPEENSLHSVLKKSKETNAAISHRIEKGITLRGKFSVGKRISEPIKITAVQGKFEDVNTLTTDLDGNFYLTGFQFYDSSSIALQALNKKGKPYGSFELSKLDTPAITHFPVVHLPLAKSTSTIPRSTDFESDAVQLREVTVTAKKEKRSYDLYGGGGFKIDYDFIKTSNYPDIISLMQARLRGVRIFQRIDANGFPREAIQINGVNGTPLLVIDGVPYGDDIDVARAIRQMSVREVQSIEVLRGPSAAVFGTRGLSGAILITTRAASGNYEDMGFNIPDKTFTYFPFYGYSSVRQFKYPDHTSESKNDRPDYRTTLYWNPTVWLDGTERQTLTFRAGDIASTYRISIMGVTIAGEPVTKDALITVAE